MAGDYGYANARVRAMKSRLLTQAGYESLLARDSIEALLSALTTTAYEQDVEAALLRGGGVSCVTEALRLNVARTFRHLRTFFDAGEPEHLVDILLSRWDLYNIRTIVRGQASRLPAPEILAALVPAGQLDRQTLETLATQNGLQATIGMMLSQRLRYANPLSVAAAGFRARGDLINLELALDRYHYATILDALAPASPHADLVRQMIRTEIDTLNLSTFLRLRPRLLNGGGQEPDLTRWLIAGGELHPGQWTRLAQAETNDEILEPLEGTPYRRLLESGLHAHERDLARPLERYLAHKGMRMWHSGDPLGIALVIGYVWAKVSEVMNVRLITYAVAGELDAATIWDELILWPS